MAKEIKTAPKEELVELYIPRGNHNDEPTELISVNGKNFVLPKGKKSMVPKYVKYEYDRAMLAQDILDGKKSQLLDAAANKQKELGL